jgi:hypothetical protein
VTVVAATVITEEFSAAVGSRDGAGDGTSKHADSSVAKTAQRGRSQRVCEIMVSS